MVDQGRLKNRESQIQSYEEERTFTIRVQSHPKGQKKGNEGGRRENERKGGEEIQK
jgi:hypothetical protein